MSGKPVLVREDPAIGFNWVDQPSGPGVNADKLPVRWTQSIYYQPGSYHFEMAVDDGARLRAE